MPSVVYSFENRSKWARLLFFYPAWSQGTQTQSSSLNTSQ